MKDIPFQPHASALARIRYHEWQRLYFLPSYVLRQLSKVKIMNDIINRAAQFIVAVGESRDIQAITAHAEVILQGKAGAKTYAPFFKALKDARLPGWFWRQYHDANQAGQIDEFENGIAIAVNEICGGGYNHG